MKLIDKDALVAEIEKWISGWTERLNTNPSNSSFFEGGIELGKSILSFIDTLEVKVADLDEEADNYWGVLSSDVRVHIYYNDYYKIAKHFFELGIAVSNEAHKGE